MERKNKVLVFVILICIAIIFITIINIPLNREVIPSKFVIGNRMGFDLTPGKLNFGQIVPGYGASRNIVVKNNYDEAIKVNIESSGAISDNLIVSDNNFVLKPFETRNVTFSLYTDKSIKVGDYEGEVVIISRVARWID